MCVCVRALARVCVCVCARVCVCVCVCVCQCLHLSVMYIHMYNNVRDTLQILVGVPREFTWKPLVGKNFCEFCCVATICEIYELLYV